MASILKSLRLIADPTRLRILNLLRREDLSVVELQDILGMGQSRISTHLSQLKQVRLVTDRRAGKNVIYTFGDEAGTVEDSLLTIIGRACDEIPEKLDDEAALTLSLHKRRDKARAYFDALAGKFGRTYLPGRSWKALAESLLRLMPPMVIADLGAGEGTFSQLLALRAEKVIAIDNSEKMVAYGAQVALENGFSHLEYRHGDLEDPPIDSNSVDIAFFSQSLHHAEKPEQALASAWRILKPGGRVVILDLLKHQVEEARDLYADLWLGFTELELVRFLEKVKFKDIEVSIVDKEAEGHLFQTLMGIATKSDVS